MAGKDDSSAAKKPKTDSSDIKTMTRKQYLDQVLKNINKVKLAGKNNQNSQELFST